MSDQTPTSSTQEIQDLVKQKYGDAARIVLGDKGSASCGCGTSAKSACCTDGTVTGGLYSEEESSTLPEAALLASLGCGNPTALAELHEGETVLDLGSGGGIDVLLSARRVGATGFAYGLDMTDEMLDLAEQNLKESGLTNVKFLKGHIEEIPLPDASVDVIISNCVINLSTDKNAVLREAFRVLKPGGRFAVSDVVTEGEIPDSVRTDMLAYVGSVAGALDKDDYLARLAATGFVDASIQPTRHYKFSDLQASTCCSPETAELPEEVKSSLDGRVMGAFIRASKAEAK